MGGQPDRSRRNSPGPGGSFCQSLAALIRIPCPLAIPVTGLVFLLLMITVQRLTIRQGMTDLGRESGYRLELYVSYLQGVLGKYEALPELLATNSRLVSFLKNPGGHGRIEALNRYLATINRISDAADTYLMDREGLTIAASNWQAERPFVGRNFSYRPYFQQAMKGQLGRYFALGIASNRRGYYFAYPVRSGGEILGAVVIKVDIGQVEHDWGQRDETFLVTDPDGVIFLSTNPDWRFRVLHPLAPEVRERIVRSRRYPGASLEPVPWVATGGDGSKSLLTLRDPRGDREFLQVSRKMSQAGWQVHLLSDTRQVRHLVRLTMIGAAAAFLLVILVLLILAQQRLRRLEQAAHQEQSRRMLEKANARLEARVRERTRALSEANERLRLEIEDRRRAEEKLRHAREEVIHTAKLAAIGQMAAGINHELNQPLAAIQAYGANGRALLAKGRVAEAIANFDRIVELTERMAGIGGQLRIFSRKSKGELDCLPLRGVIDGALEVTRPLLHRMRLRPRISLRPDSLQVRANSLLLQQVLVNLLTNGLHAVAEVDQPEIVLEGGCDDGRVWIRVRDNGPGVDERDRDRIFEPFYTSKPAGQGLGLGLSISRRIILDMGGTLDLVGSGPGGCFEIRLDGCSLDQAESEHCDNTRRKP